MGSYRLTRQISATPSEVSRAFSDPALMVDWMDATEIKDITGPLDRPGSRFTFVVSSAWRLRMEIVRVEDGRLHEIAGTGLLGTRARMTATLTPHGDGTHLDFLTEYSLPFGPIGRWLDRRFIDREPRTIANLELDRLVALVTNPSIVPQPKGATRAAVPA